MGRRAKQAQDFVESIDSQVSGVVPQELSAWPDERILSYSDVIRQTQQFWSRRGFNLSAFECQELIQNMNNFITILDGWQRQSEK